MWSIIEDPATVNSSERTAAVAIVSAFVKKGNAFEYVKNMVIGDEPGVALMKSGDPKMKVVEGRDNTQSVGKSFV